MTTELAENLISVPKAAMLLGLSIPYTQRLIRSGTIKGQKIGRDWFTTQEDVKAYVKSRKRSRQARTWGDL